MYGDVEVGHMTKAIQKVREDEQKLFDRVTGGVRDISCHVFAGVVNGSIPLKTSKKANALAGKINSLCRRFIGSQDLAQLLEAESLLGELKALFADSGIPVRD
jgi:hypothetical protein